MLKKNYKSEYDNVDVLVDIPVHVCVTVVSNRAKKNKKKNGRNKCCSYM